MRPAPPWTDIGALQSEIYALKSDLFQKTDKYETASLRGRLDDLEYSLREIRAVCDGLQYRLQQMEENR